MLEIGTNKVSFKNKFNFGFGAEYYIGKNKNLLIKFKYINNSANYFKEGSSCGFAGFFCSSTKSLIYENTSLKIPMNYKWETNFLLDNFKLFVTSGLAINYILKEKYIELKNIEVTNDKANIQFNAGIGISYRLNSTIDFYSSVIKYSGIAKSKEKFGFILSSKIRTKESSVNFGLRLKL